MSVLFSSYTYAAPKNLKPIEKQSVEFNLSQFCSYLENGKPHQLEGVYTSPDERYKIAIVKNDEKQHDFIGIVITADNHYWEPGDVKFNFVMKDNALKGYYYNQAGDEFPMQFQIDADTLNTKSLKKLKVKTVKADMLAGL